MPLRGTCPALTNVVTTAFIAGSLHRTGWPNYHGCEVSAGGGIAIPNLNP